MRALAMYTPFLIVVTLAGALPFLAAALPAYFSNLSAGLAYYSADAKADLFRRRSSTGFRRRQGRRRLSPFD
jgi:hypothetical protein